MTATLPAEVQNTNNDSMTTITTIALPPVHRHQPNQQRYVRQWGEVHRFDPVSPLPMLRSAKGAAWQQRLPLWVPPMRPLAPAQRAHYLDGSCVTRDQKILVKCSCAQFHFEPAYHYRSRQTVATRQRYWWPFSHRARPDTSSRPKSKTVGKPTWSNTHAARHAPRHDHRQSNGRNIGEASAVL